MDSDNSTFSAFYAKIFEAFNLSTIGLWNLLANRKRIACLRSTLKWKCSSNIFRHTKAPGTTERTSQDRSLFEEQISIVVISLWFDKYHIFLQQIFILNTHITLECKIQITGSDSVTFALSRRKKVALTFQYIYTRICTEQKQYS
jgi:hypothetical protein